MSNSNQWLRLWHDMPNDPKWRTISRISGQPITLVISLYVHLLVDASRNVTRGHLDVTPEDLASALDVTEEDISAVLSAMQGRVIEGSKLSGWEGRQVKREDDGNPETGTKSAAQRKREQRQREKEARENGQCHDESRNVTLDKIREETPTSLRSVGESYAQDNSRTTAPADMQPERTHLAIAGNLNLDVHAELAKFLDHHRAEGSTYADWNAAFSKWLRTARQFGSGKDQQRQPQQSRQDAIANACDTLGVGSQYLSQETTHALR